MGPASLPSPSVSPSSPQEEREAAFRELSAREFDLLVVGGGVTGCGVARDAALRGLQVALVEMKDFAAGTSSKSSKLIHGGLRYLEHAQFRLVFEGTNERALLLQLARHLVRPLPFLMPAYKASGHGLLKLDVGLWIYDALSKFSSPRLHRTYRAPRIHQMEPALRTEALKGGIVYYDALTDDARLTLENAQDARELGAVILNHVRAGRLFRNEAGAVCGAEVFDVEPGARTLPVRVRAKVVVNASGPWSDEVRALVQETPVLKASKGVHLVVDTRRLKVNHAIVMLAKKDKRVMFAIPWGNRTVLGTTDTFFDGSPDRVFANRDDAEYILETANHYFPDAKLTLDDALSSWAGLRPLVAPQSKALDASDVSREHHVLSSPGFITIAGGKLTTFRRIAAEVVDAAQKQLGKDTPSTTGERSLPGARGVASDEELSMLVQQLEEKGAAPAVARHLVSTYGVNAARVAARGFADGAAFAPLDPDLPYVAAEVDEAVDQGWARTLEDAIGRRIPLLLKSHDMGLAASGRVAERMAQRLGWSAERTREELERYRAVVEDNRRFKTA